MSPEGFSCKQCGRCCLDTEAHYSGATGADVALWEERNRYDILQWVDEVLPGVYDIWIDPRTGDDVGSCPWLQQSPQQGRYVCRIQDVKPESCRKYPFTKDHAGKTGCRGFE